MARTSTPRARKRQPAATTRWAITKGAFQLATLVEEAPVGEGWVYERKLDGFRAMADIGRKGSVELWSRNGLSFNEQFPQVVKALAGLSSLHGCIVDGEIVAYERGVVSFHAMQLAREASGASLAYYVFDLLFDHGDDVRSLPLTERRERLRAHLGTEGVVRRLEYDTDGERAMAMARQAGDEGIIAKRASAPYRGERSLVWQKIKITTEDDFVVVGYTPSKKTASAMGSLVLATRDTAGAKLRYAGRVGTGFSEALRAQLGRRLSRMRADAPAVDVPRELARGVMWTEPKLVVRVAYFSYTPDGALRHPVFRGERDDLGAEAVARELPVHTR